MAPVAVGPPELITDTGGRVDQSETRTAGAAHELSGVCEIRETPQFIVPPHLRSGTGVVRNDTIRVEHRHTPVDVERRPGDGV
ncbi:hypothetical protein M0E84_08220 [Corynebacterium sp. CCM 9186]|uniref:hypothetical protein n=1 Tax=Corynebacterium meridianum TaxID=2765363 RepID=UPI002004DE3E|nr:hypothetical protein [Corynebacterium meridianum]MCK7678013.1 hypothetical protein [Corynebacterium meridianum]